MDLVKSGAVTNRRKATCGASPSFPMPSVPRNSCRGCTAILWWSFRDRQVFDPIQIGQNPKFAAILPARKVDLSGMIALHFGRGNVAAGPGRPWTS